MATDPGRANLPALDEAVLTARLRAAAWPWPAVRIAPSTRSTNADVVLLAEAGAPHGTVVTTDYQSAGKGRLGRRWEAPPRSAVMCSVLLRPARPLGVEQGWVPLLVGVAVAEAISNVAGLEVQLKWPNDLVLADLKLGGILVERPSADALVAGFGVNVSLSPDELPVPTATSLVIAGVADVVREDLLAAILLHLAGWWERWQSADFDAVRSGLAAAYRTRCSTLGREVDVRTPDGAVSRAVAVDLATDGALMIAPVATPGARPTAVRAADVIHIRPI